MKIKAVIEWLLGEAELQRTYESERFINQILADHDLGLITWSTADHGDRYVGNCDKYKCRVNWIRTWTGIKWNLYVRLTAEPKYETKLELTIDQVERIAAKVTLPPKYSTDKVLEGMRHDCERTNLK